MYWSLAPDWLVPAAVVTVICTVPVPGGEVAVICPGLSTLNFEAVAPKSTAVAPVNEVPVIVTTVPAAPEVGLKPVMLGAAGV